MSRNISYYLTIIVWSKIRYYLFWGGAGDFPDRFLQLPNGAIYFSKNQDEARKLAHLSGFIESTEHILVVDLDQVWLSLDRKKSFKVLSRSDCRAILNAWNILEDLARTLNYKTSPFKRSSRRLLQDIYEKLFDCADVLEQRPEGEFRFSPRERSTMKNFLFHTWKGVRYHRLWRG